jgi:hypothetical protein
VAYVVYFVSDPASLPREALGEVRATMQQVADSVSTIPSSNPFWLSIQRSVLQIDVAGYRVMYRILPRAGEVHIVELQRLPPED